MADRNPSPPPDIPEELQFADTIGQTVYSKHWLFTLLMRVIEKVENESGHGFSVGSLTPLRAGIDTTPRLDHAEQEFSATFLKGFGCDSCTASPQKSSSARYHSAQQPMQSSEPNPDVEDIEADLEEDLCKLWDITVNKEVLKFLRDFEIIKIFTAVIACPRYPRLVEICIGILANLACEEDAAVEMTQYPQLIGLIIDSLNCRDTPTLTETARFIHTVLSAKEAKSGWLEAIRNSVDVYENLNFILTSSTNGPLLMGCVQVIEVLLREDDTLANQWCGLKLLDAVLEAQRQMEWLHGSYVEVFHRLFYVFSSNESGVIALIARFAEVYRTFCIYLNKVCEDEANVLPMQRYRNSVRSILPVLDVIVCNTDEVTAVSVIQSNNECVVYILKLLCASVLLNNGDFNDGVAEDILSFFKVFIQITCKYLLSVEDIEKVTWLPYVAHHPEGSGYLDYLVSGLQSHQYAFDQFLGLCQSLQLNQLYRHLVDISTNGDRHDHRVSKHFRKSS